MQQTHSKSNSKKGFYPYLNAQFLSALADNALLFASIRNLVQGSNNEQNSNYGCPRVLRMDYCGLGPPFCRAIGKVSSTLNEMFNIQ